MPQWLDLEQPFLHLPTRVSVAEGLLRNYVKPIPNPFAFLELVPPYDELMVEVYGQNQM